MVGRAAGPNRVPVADGRPVRVETKDSWTFGSFVVIGLQWSAGVEKEKSGPDGEEGVSRVDV